MILPNQWSFSMTKDADKSFEKIPKNTQKRIVDFFEKRVLLYGKPKEFGKPLAGRTQGYWSYRVGDYRIIAEVRENELLILVVEVAHRRHVYDFKP